MKSKEIKIYFETYSFSLSKSYLQGRKYILGVKKGNKKSPKSITFHKSALISDLDIKDFIFFYS